MPTSKRAFVAINLALGPLVPLSYVVSARTWPEHTDKLWGTIGGWMQSAYTGNMLLATLGYLLFSWWLWRHTSVAGPDQDGTRFLGRYGLGIINLAYLLILVASMVWMPLSLYALAHQAPLMTAIVVVLATVAAGSLLLAACLFSARPAGSPRSLWLARVGVVFFCVQTVLLDAIIWPSAFSI